MGLSQSALANKLRLLTVSPEIRTRCGGGAVDRASHPGIAAAAEQEQQLEMIGEIQKNQLTVSQTERRVEQILKKKKQKPRPRAMVRDVRIFVNTVNRAVELDGERGDSGQR